MFLVLVWTRECCEWGDCVWAKLEEIWCALFYVEKLIQYAFHIWSYSWLEILRRVWIMSWEAREYDRSKVCTDWISGIGIRPLRVEWREYGYSGEGWKEKDGWEEMVCFK